MIIACNIICNRISIVKIVDKLNDFTLVSAALLNEFKEIVSIIVGIHLLYPEKIFYQCSIVFLVSNTSFLNRCFLHYYFDFASDFF
jgi:Na+-translocating ferredoxin:NAD+ oxidoreductase RnfD subunit